jgi:integrase
MFPYVPVSVPAQTGTRSLNMASIFRRPDAKHWFAAYRAADGRRLKVSTKTEDKKEAQRTADRLELEAREELERRKASASLTGVNDAMQRATQLAMAGRLDAGKARDLINNLLAATGQKAIDAVSHQAWCESWLACKNGAVKEGSKVKYKQISRDWLLFLGNHADKPLELITRTEVVSFRDSLAAEGLAAQTINHTIKILRGIYNEAFEQGYIGRNPFLGVKGLRANSEAPSRQPFTAAEVAALIAEADGDWKGIVILSATTGLRLMDAARLRWHDLKLDQNLVRTKTAKTGAVLTLPLHTSFIAWLDVQPRGIGAAPVFPSLAKKAGAGKSGLSMAFKRLMTRAGVSGGIVDAPGLSRRGRTLSPKSFHSLRHFAATQLASAGVRAEIARQITGHADAESHANYITADFDALRRAVQAISLTA